jgi:hypothetical protein
MYINLFILFFSSFVGKENGMPICLKALAIGHLYVKFSGIYPYGGVSEL